MQSVSGASPEQADACATPHLHVPFTQGGDSEGHRPQGPPQGTHSAAGPGLQVSPSSAVCVLTLLLLHSNS